MWIYSEWDNASRIVSKWNLPGLLQTRRCCSSRLLRSLIQECCSPNIEESPNAKYGNSREKGSEVRVQSLTSWADNRRKALIGPETQLDILSPYIVHWHTAGGHSGLQMRIATDGTVHLRIDQGEDIWEYVAHTLDFRLPSFLTLTTRVTSYGWEISAGSSTPTRIQLHSVSLHIVIESCSSHFILREFTRRGHALTCLWNIRPTDHLYGLGEKVGGLDKRGRRWTQWTTDAAPHTEATDAMYQAHPFALVGGGEGWRGMFLAATERSHCDATVPWQLRLTVEDGPLSLYCLPGPDPASVLERYTALVGRMPMPPVYALGFHQSRWSYATADEVWDLAQQFRTRGIPLDVIHLDIDYMDGYRVFTTNAQAFPDLRVLADKLQSLGTRLVAIVDPGVKVDEKYATYQEGHSRHYFMSFLNGQEFHSRVWPGVCAFPDFMRRDVREWWGECNAALVTEGIAGIWNDMNEPAMWGPVGNQSSLDAMEEYGLIHHGDHDQEFPHHWVHNVFALLEAAATYQGLSTHTARPFILSRSGFSGIQRYAAVWTGDNESTWQHLRMAIPMCLNLGLSGVPFVGPDIGGFGGNASPELYARWVQMGSFFPFARAHTSIGTSRHEPWSFGEEAERIAQQYLRYRYRLLPYLYSLFYQAHRFGHPVMRPLWWTGSSPESLIIDDEFLLGNFLLVAPVVEEQARARTVYFPSGSWYSVWGREMLEGGTRQRVTAPLDQLPVFLKAGAIIPVADPVLTTQAWSTSPWPSRLRVIPGNGQFTFYADDGQSQNYRTGDYLAIQMGVEVSGDQLTFSWRHDSTGDHAGRPETPVTVAIGPLSAPPLQVSILESRGELGSWDFHDHMLEVSINLLMEAGEIAVRLPRKA